ncbi:NAD(P)H nitroreductase [Mycobacterium sp. CVI_P3]|uniref:NAD(P)H nitroreductase n=1 Tax=Mycobacterium pinniadriaticum TaxID=2994102 RepID=A0ABT3SCK4_9MYCO|nr:NAD(P)H nitroreductase [Mycobacterium pinniadriaticum]MCX2930822.1 NAD(P)H nitroreductase [Mycobacterium pinniadriaticum]MCX2937246.1 NAD(P)H nitroreductase [Mycobacterium pinniadriaticum]
MALDFPDTATLHTVLAQALRAPSIGNSQPWRWRISNRALHLYADPDVQLPSSDPDGRERIISCGAALHHCAVALAAAGWHAQISRFPDRANPDHLAEIRPFRAQPTEADIALAKAIPRRRADRRPYGQRAIPSVAIASICARLSETGVIAREVRSVPRLRRIVAQAIHQHATDPEYLAELEKWTIRASSATAGEWGGGDTASEGSADNGPDNAVILALGTANDRMLAWLRAGEASSMVLLAATAAGFACCPLTEPLEIAETRDAVQREVFSDQASPQMLLRVGWAQCSGAPCSPTSRRPMADVVSYVDGTRFD